MKDLNQEQRISSPKTVKDQLYTPEKEKPLIKNVSNSSAVHNPFTHFKTTIT